MIIRVANIASSAVGRNNVYVATDDIKIKDLCIKNDFNVIMTSSTHPCCTDKSLKRQKRLMNIIVNLQEMNNVGS